MRRIIVVFVVALIATAAYAGGQSEPPEIGVGSDDTVYISPGSSPGVQDELTIPVSIGEIGGNNVIVSYQIEIRDASGNVVWVESAVDETEQPGFFGRLMENLGLRDRQTTVRIPETTSWVGTYRGSDVGSDGGSVPDGEYTYVMTITDNREVTTASEPRTVVVDNIPPEATASVNWDIFSPDGDGRRDAVTLTQQTSSEDEWAGRITSNGDTIYEVFWTGEAAAQFTWNGRNLAETEVDDGLYTYSLTSTDRAGNPGSIDPITVTVDTAPRVIDLAASTPAFSPNGDGVKDTVSLSFGEPPIDLLQSAVITVTDERGRSVGSADIGDAIGGSVVLTGHLDQQRTRVAPDGTYLVSVTAMYENGAVVTDGPIEVTVDTVAPSGTVRVSDNVFSPEGDGLKDTVRIIHNLDDDADWTGYVYVAGGEVLQTLQLGSDVPSSVGWDGRGLDGQPIPDGTYSYSLIGTDAAGNQYQTNQVRVSIDRRPTNVGVTVNREYFSPNGDGEGDVVIARPDISLRSGIADYTFSVANADGEEVLTGRGEGAPPREIVWDGRGPAGEVLPEGGYVGILDLVYEKGNRPRGVTPVVNIDNTIPQVALRASNTRITPNDDDEDETITFVPIVNPANQIVRFTGQVVSLDGRIVRELSGTRPVGAAVWDGTNQRGTVVPDGSYIGTLEVEHRNGTVRRAQTGTVALSTFEYTGPPPVALRLSPRVFSPDGDGFADTVAVTIAVGDGRPVAEWTITVRDPRGRVFYEFTGQGEPVRSFAWDGRNDAGQRVEMATDYRVSYEVTDAEGNTATGSETLTVDILTVERFGMRKIDLPDVIFEGYTTRYLNWNKELSERNVGVLDRIAGALKKFPQYEIELHGHAVSVLYDDKELSDLEQEQTLLPLSEGRSETIREAMATRGIDSDRFTLEWWGKLRPIVPFSNLEDRFVDRRVEFYLIR